MQSLFGVGNLESAARRSEAIKSRRIVRARPRTIERFNQFDFLLPGHDCPLFGSKLKEMPGRALRVLVALRFRKRVAIRIFAPKISVIMRKTMYTESLGQ